MEQESKAMGYLKKHPSLALLGYFPLIYLPIILLAAPYAAIVFAAWVFGRIFKLPDLSLWEGLRPIIMWPTTLRNDLRYKAEWPGAFL